MTTYSIPLTVLYIKQHSITGLKYFGKTTKDPLKYNGSGKHWLRHLKKHGRKHIITTWVSEPYTDKDAIVEFALAFSKDNNIVESELWANIRPENGLDGGGNKGISPSAETKQKMSASKLGKTTWNKGIPRSDETKQKISDAKKDKPTGKKGIPSGRKGIPTGPHSAETKQKMHDAKIGKPRGPYRKQQNPHGPCGKQQKTRGPYGKQRNPHGPSGKQQNPHGPYGKQRNPAPEIKCPHCGLVGGASGMIRWHFDNCKKKPL